MVRPINEWLPLVWRDPGRREAGEGMARGGEGGVVCTGRRHGREGRRGEDGIVTNGRREEGKIWGGMGMGGMWTGGSTLRPNP